MQDTTSILVVTDIRKTGTFPGALFLLGYAPIFTAASVLVFLYPKEDLHLLLTSRHAPWMDHLMRYWTYLGDGALIAVFLAGILFVSLRFFLTGLSAFAISGLAAQLLKRVFFSSSPRPAKFFEIHDPGRDLHLVPGVDMLTWMSFPSGHAATSFALCFAFSLLIPSRPVQALLLVVAAGVACSRVYLSQHFLEDVLAGSLLGILSGWLAWRWIRTARGNWLDNSVLKLKKQ